MLRRRRKTEQKITDYRHEAKRKNIPPAGLAAHGEVACDLQQCYAPTFPPSCASAPPANNCPPAPPEKANKAC